MPAVAGVARRGELHLLARRRARSPPSCWCTPERILISVDLPAPLSPRMQVTSPAFDVQRDVLERDHVAEVLGDVLELEQVRRRLRSRSVVIAARRAGGSPCSAARPRPGPRPRRSRPSSSPSPSTMIPICAMPSDRRTERGADHRAVAAGEQAAADDRGDDELELAPDALVALDPAELNRGHHAPAARPPSRSP